uniref:Uncharacterized protein n=1 Tax=Chromera velia CCMP2878 TaxID=1169474 RepID=A0A0G4G250_9ALVE|eukprot:Cvel_4051.t1-p1 / transcript=Cvel_4051.t1 / gene=Cvel_4051 / organism=Chromera_velia_CCMP2878 / gene_product=hypothetical protein / transcript_product=hypothetical protein / location=Cvel_scaffold172:75584-80607(+) / protein_length=880 / sequence_SO=supercontig / SO=protein_coding / is_pseudo=false
MDSAKQESQAPPSATVGVTGSESDTTESDTIFNVLLKNEVPTSEVVSDMSSSRDCFSTAWLCLSAMFKRKIADGQFRRLDVSGCNLSARKNYLLLDSLPDSVTDLKLGPSAVKGAALPLVRHFLESLSVTEEDAGEGERMEEQEGESEDSSDESDGGEESEGVPVSLSLSRVRLKSLSFSDGSVGPAEGPVVFGSLPGSLEVLNLEGNELGAAFVALARAMRIGKSSALVSLNLSRTGMTDENMRTLSNGLSAAKPLKIERLFLGGNHFRSGMFLTSFIGKETLPHLKSLCFADCRLAPAFLRAFADLIGSGGLTSLESLVLKGVSFGRGGEGARFADCLKSSFLPALKRLNLNGCMMGTSGEEKLIIALGAEGERPPDLESVQLPQLHLRGENTSFAQILGEGRLPSITQKILHLSLEPVPAVAFFTALGDSTKPPPWECLHLSLKERQGAFGESDSHVLVALANAVRAGRMGALFGLDPSDLRSKIGGSDDEESENENGGEAGGEGGIALLRALRFFEVPMLSQLNLSEQDLGDREMGLIGEAVKAGNCPSLSVLDLSYNSFGRDGMKALMEGIRDASQGLPLLERLDLSHTKAGLGFDFLSGTLSAGKLPALKSLLLKYVLVDSEYMQRLAEAVRGGHLSELRTLNLSHPGLYRPPRYSYPLRFPASTNLNALFEAVCESEKGLPLLENFAFAGHRHLSAAAFCKAVEQKKIPKLRDLDFFGCGLRNDFVIALSDALKVSELPDLTKLNVSSNRIRQTGLSVFFASIRPESLPNLETFLLQKNWGSGRTIKRLMENAKAEGKLPSLVHGIAEEGGREVMRDSDFESKDSSDSEVSASYNFRYFEEDEGDSDSEASDRSSEEDGDDSDEEDSDKEDLE